MFYRLNLLITRCIYLCCIAENINKIFSLKNFILITYIYIFVNL